MIRGRVARFAAPILLLAACSGDARTTGINNALRDLPAWETPRTTNTIETSLAAGEVRVGASTYTCTLSDPIALDPATTEYRDIMTPGLQSDALYPGALLQGRGAGEGRLETVRLARAPITLTTTMNIEEPSITVADPTAATMREAIATLLRRGDSRTGAIDVTSGTVLMRKVEAFSFAQSLNQVGISTAYAGPVGSLAADFNYGSGRAANAHSVMVVLIQPLLTISFSDDRIAAPADLFANSVTAAAIESERAAGRLGADNIPVYVRSVTYGRVMMYTLTSTRVESYSQLAAAVEASYKGFTGSGTYSQDQRDIIANSQNTLISFGGPQDAAVSAIVDLGRYFVAMEPTQATPISYELRDLRGHVAAIGDITQYRRRECGQRAIDYSWSISLSGIDDSAYIRLNGSQRGGDNNSARSIDLNPWTQRENNDLEVVLYNNGLTGGSLQFELTRNRARVGYDNFTVNSPVCVGGCWYTWRFVYNDTTGAVSQIGSNPPR